MALESFQSIFSMLSTAPLAQELCLFCFFCLGFAVCRINVVKHFIGQATGFSASRRLSPAELLALQKQQRYEEVCEAWPCLEDFTLEAFSAVVDALLALDRPEDVGLFFYKAAVNLSHLRFEARAAAGAQPCHVDQGLQWQGPQRKDHKDRRTPRTRG